MAAPADEPLSRAARRRNRRLTDILTATADVLAEHGYRETNLDEIAERLDLTRRWSTNDSARPPDSRRGPPASGSPC